jgi:hypothetical protein
MLTAREFLDREGVHSRTGSRLSMPPPPQRITTAVRRSWIFFELGDQPSTLNRLTQYA